MVMTVKNFKRITKYCLFLKINPSLAEKLKSLQTVVLRENELIKQQMKDKRQSILDLTADHNICSENTES